jgi:hypothetical protein
MDWTGQEPVLRLRSLLGPEPETPWAALIPQLMLWSFRRFCIQHLSSLEDNRLLDYMWDSLLELVQKYSPKGLQHVVHTWMTPENLSLLSSTPEQYNQFFIECIQALDEAISSNNSALEDVIIELLDVKIRTTIMEWLSGPSRAFFIFPMNEEQSHMFTHSQFLNLVRVLLDYSARRSSIQGKKLEHPKIFQTARAADVVSAATAAVPAPTTAPTTAPVTAPVTVPEVPVPETPAPLVPAAEPVVEAPAPVVAAPEAVEPAPAPEAPEPPPAAEAAAHEPDEITSVRQAIQRRKTLKAAGRRHLPVTPVKGSKPTHRFTRRVSTHPKPISS